MKGLYFFSAKLFMASKSIWEPHKKVYEQISFKNVQKKPQRAFFVHQN